MDDNMDVSHVSGNASDDIKRVFNPPLAFVIAVGTEKQFALPIVERMVLKEISILDKAEEPLKKESRLVCELDVAEGTYI